MRPMWRRLFVILVILHTAHVPVPVPDLDGEWQGVAIGGLADPAAWGFVLLGVRPNDDIDRGPIRHASPRDTADQTGPPFGAAAVSLGAWSMHMSLVIRRGFDTRVAAIVVMPAMQQSLPRLLTAGRGDRTEAACDSPGAARASLCVWHL